MSFLPCIGLALESLQTPTAADSRKDCADRANPAAAVGYAMTTVQELEVTVTSHIDVCAVRYDAIHARLKRLEKLVMTVGGTIIVILLGALGTMTSMLVDAIK